MKEILNYKKYLTACIVLALMLCLAQITGNTLLILACLSLFLLLAGWCCTNNFTLPILLFFLPWSPLLKLEPTGHSFYTFGMVLICLISIVKKQFNFRNYQIKAGVLILLVTLLSKLLDGNFLAFDYIAFIMMIILFPSVKEEWQERKYNFYQIVFFLALGVIIASICAMFFAEFSNIQKYIKVDAYLSIIRRSGFYMDSNFYTAQVLAALGGCLVLLLREEKKERLIFLGVTAIFLLYCGFLSGSKSFVLVATAVLLLWIIAVLRLRGREGLKATLLISLLSVAIFVATSALFSDLIKVLLTRFASTRDLNSFTTGRIELWESYFVEILGNAKVFFLGKGFTNVKLEGRGSHNTIIQMFYQFGIIGNVVLAYWIICFFRETRNPLQKHEQKSLCPAIVFLGAFAPWLAIDALFFDEFFLLQWYMLMALNYLRSDEGISIERPVLMEGNYGRENKE